MSQVPNSERIGAKWGGPGRAQPGGPLGMRRPLTERSHGPAVRTVGQSCQGLLVVSAPSRACTERRTEEVTPRPQSARTGCDLTRPGHPMCGDESTGAWQNWREPHVGCPVLCAVPPDADAGAPDGPRFPKGHRPHPVRESGSHPSGQVLTGIPSERGRVPIDIDRLVDKRVVRAGQAA